MKVRDLENALRDMSPDASAVGIDAIPKEGFPGFAFKPSHILGPSPVKNAAPEFRLYIVFRKGPVPWYIISVSLRSTERGGNIRVTVFLRSTERPFFRLAPIATVFLRSTYSVPQGHYVLFFRCRR